MLVTELYNGQGLGNQLWCYCVTRCIAIKNGYDFGIMSPEKFKGKKIFKKIDFGKKVEGGSGPEGGPPHTLPIGVTKYYKERVEFNPFFGCDVSRLDKSLLNVGDNTKIDGTMQCEDYIYDYRDKIIKWLETDHIESIKKYIDDNICIIHVRGGDFFHQQEVSLRNQYYSSSIKFLLQKNSEMKFYVITDDVNVANIVVPGVEIIGSTPHGCDEFKANHHLGGDISLDFNIIKNAKNLIISNSSFAWWGAWLNKTCNNVIAPKYWSRYNISNGFWSNGDSLTRDWIYLCRDNNSYTYNYCLKEKNKFEEDNKDLFITRL